MGFQRLEGKECSSLPDTIMLKEPGGIGRSKTVFDTRARHVHTKETDCPRLKR